MRLQHQIRLSFTLTIVLLTACSPTISVETQTTNTPQPTITPTVITMDQNVEAFLSGEFDDVSNQSLEERKEFSILLAQKMNEARGARPLIYINEAYVDPITGMIKDYDGHPDLSETIQMYLAVALDEEENLLVQNEESTWVKINGSKDIDWNMVATDPNDTRIDWPIGHENKYGLSPAQITIENGSKFIPMILLNREASQLYLGGDTPGIMPVFTLLKIETENSGVPILARKVIFWGVNLMLCKEGSDFLVQQNMIDSWADGYSETKEKSPFFNNLKSNQLYYATVNQNQPRGYDLGKVTYIEESYSNVVSVSDSFQVLDDQEPDSINMLIVKLGVLIEPN